MRSVFLFVLISLFLISGCTDEPSGPQPPAPLDTTSHEFTWEVDTVSSGQYFQGNVFYGTSATNVYLAGYSTHPKEMSWHWNGEYWERFDISEQMGRDIADIDGLGSEFIAFLGRDPGNSGFDLPNIKIIDNGIIGSIEVPKGKRMRTCLHVAARDEIYLGGLDGIQRFNGSEWEWLLDSTDSVIDTYGIRFSPLSIYHYPGGGIEFISRRGRNPESEKTYLWRWINGHFAVADSFAENEADRHNIRFGYKFHDTGSEILSASPGGIFRHTSGTSERIHDQRPARVTGTFNNLFGYYEGFLHYNGATWKDLYPDILASYPGLSMQTVYDFLYIDGVVFISMRSNDISIVVRGIQVK